MSRWTNFRNAVTGKSSPVDYAKSSWNQNSGAIMGAALFGPGGAVAGAGLDMLKYRRPSNNAINTEDQLALRDSLTIRPGNQTAKTIADAIERTYRSQGYGGAAAAQAGRMGQNDAMLQLLGLSEDYYGGLEDLRKSVLQARAGYQPTSNALAALKGGVGGAANLISMIDFKRTGTAQASSS